MYIQSRVYKFNSTKKEVQDKIVRLSDHPYLGIEWINEHTFCLQKKSLGFFKLEGDIDELDNNKKIKIDIRTGYGYLLLYILPLAVAVYGLTQWPKDSDKGLLLVVGGFSLFGLIFLTASAMMDSLKKNFKEEFQII